MDIRRHIWLQQIASPKVLSFYGHFLRAGGPLINSKCFLIKKNPLIKGPKDKVHEQITHNFLKTLKFVKRKTIPNGYPCCRALRNP